MEVERIPCLSDNYVWLLKESSSGKVAVVDPSEFGPVDSVLESRGLKLDYIINTHHHFDHTGGNLQLQKKYGCEVVGAKSDRDRIPGIQTALGDGDTWKFGSLDVVCYETPGHTSGHVTYYVPEAKSVFPGDTLFLMGCGRVFEGTPEQMHASLSKIKALPADTKVYCAHEYTQANAKFALVVNPGNQELKARAAEVAGMRAKGEATVPGVLGQELATNPFLRWDDAEIKKSVGLSSGASDVETFAAVRRAKDRF
uniref:hydroxyacylglutathione hydrolase n=1 Tax=Tetraselmis sp. GSL018 TaxID=582737 RepID=A0A061RZ71_9CHLO|mmetsp:Transcript_42172/g.100002  ORF Transcript_42172/g.100002 Transcript_42172/m.100002 type:complete len:255 (-) Transcript_42172:178-942(-)